VPTFVDRGVSRGQRGGSPTVVNILTVTKLISDNELVRRNPVQTPLESGVHFPRRCLPRLCAAVGVTRRGHTRCRSLGAAEHAPGHQQRLTGLSCGHPSSSILICKRLDGFPPRNFCISLQSSLPDSPRAAQGRGYFSIFNFPVSDA
jgi:hypothetical protein